MTKQTPNFYALLIGIDFYFPIGCQKVTTIKTCGDVFKILTMSKPI
jgi:hypothetical protein